jgi:hypothetical protein
VEINLVGGDVYNSMLVVLTLKGAAGKIYRTSVKKSFLMTNIDHNGN